MKYRVVDGTLFFSADYSTPRGYQFWQKVERVTQKYLKFALGVGITLLVWAWCDALTPPSYSHAQMQTYSTHYLNQFLHAR